MKELKCPKCGHVFQVDEADYASIVSQVKNAEFNEEVNRRLSELDKSHKAEQELAVTKAEQAFKEQLSQKQSELSEKDSTIEGLKAKLESIEAQKKSDMVAALAQKEQEITELKSTIKQSESTLELAVERERNNAKQEVQKKETEILELRSKLELQQQEAELNKTSLTQQYEEQKRLLQEQIDYYKDLKTKMSTKMVGERLEQYCSNEFEQYIRPFMPNAYFSKDNDASEGTKGDFIFRDSEDGTEYISIMFEMKNEMDKTATKHKNEDFLKKLDEDRKKKNCEFAVLVSLLEADNDLYNNGIVNKSHRYPKMYVIRPQFFVPFINVLVQTSKKSLEYKKQLAIAQSKEVDVTNFENKVEDFKTKFCSHVENASKKFDNAIKQIDETIKKLQSMKENLLGSKKNLLLAQQDTDALSIRKLTHKNPAMKAMFAEAHEVNDKAESENED